MPILKDMDGQSINAVGKDIHGDKSNARTRVQINAGMVNSVHYRFTQHRKTIQLMQKSL